MPGLDPKKMNSLMKQMGMSQEEINAERVIIETSEKRIIITDPSVIKIKMQGQTNFQISGNITEEEKENNLDEDIKTLIEKTSCTEEEARRALSENNRDLTEALLSLS